MQRSERLQAFWDYIRSLGGDFAVYYYSKYEADLSSVIYVRSSGIVG